MLCIPKIMYLLVISRIDIHIRDTQQKAILFCLFVDFQYNNFHVFNMQVTLKWIIYGSWYNTVSCDLIQSLQHKWLDKITEVELDAAL